MFDLTHKNVNQYSRDELTVLFTDPNDDKTDKYYDFCNDVAILFALIEHVTGKRVVRDSSTII
jgi:hypothetical protein